MDRILVIEDDRRLARLVLVALRSQGWFVRWVTNAGDAEDEIAAHDYALVVIDLDPAMEGERLLLSVLSAHPHHRVIVMSGSADTQWIVWCLNTGAGYISKPFSIAGLLAHVQARLGPPAAAPATSRRLPAEGGAGRHRGSPRQPSPGPWWDPPGSKSPS